MSKKPTKTNVFQPSTKKVTIQVSARYNWMCRQPTGEYLFSVKKPIFTSNGDHHPEDAGYPEAGQLIEWWLVRDGDLELNVEHEYMDYLGGWKNSLVKI